ncbi:MAG: ABC transporter-like protein, ATP-binding cassette, subfamily F, member 3 [Candidatus Peregrinibacteria bacterium GW2011_GWF2_38_29]|nr:MAG: ABC transporter-like protein, ATP-binding cassette, subfamily F, member 3 [Candidatus Peregrinibacteria bacterium GW2011_GWF2_38_29]
MPFPDKTATNLNTINYKDMEHGNVVLRFDKVSFFYDHNKPILSEADFSVRENAKITIMGQNGAGKSTIFKLILGAVDAKEDVAKDMTLKPISGKVNVLNGASVGIGLQVMPKRFFEHTVLEYFKTAFQEVPRNIDKLIKDVLEVVQFEADLNKKIKDFSGGQLARLLLAYALIQEPDILLLDEPTNNLDTDGIDHLTGFLMGYQKTVIVISHDANFLNSFTDGVLNLDVYTKKVEQYVGDYFDVIEQIAGNLERERRKNAQLEKNIQDRKDKINFFAHKGGKMRKLASKLRDEAEEDEENMVEVRRDDKTIKNFIIPAQTWSEVISRISSVGIIVGHKRISKKVEMKLFSRSKLKITGPNGIGKSTLLKELAAGESKGTSITEGVKVGYYQQDFSGLDFNKTTYDSLLEMMEEPSIEKVYATGAHFLLTSELMKNKVGSLSEGQKGLLCYARFVLQEPGLLILDEPTNHINFRHLPVIAKAINDYKGAIILVSHMPEFVEQIEFNELLDLKELL